MWGPVQVQDAPAELARERARMVAIANFMVL